MNRNLLVSIPNHQISINSSQVNYNGHPKTFWTRYLEVPAQGEKFEFSTYSHAVLDHENSGIIKGVVLMETYSTREGNISYHRPFDILFPGQETERDAVERKLLKRLVVSLEDHFELRGTSLLICPDRNVPLEKAKQILSGTAPLTDYFGSE